jgi:hypothetical protein
MQHPAERIRPINRRPRPSENLDPVERCVVERQDVLQVPAPVNSIVEAHPIDHQQELIRLETAQNWAAATLLTALDKHFASLLQHIGRGGLAEEGEVARGHYPNALRHVAPRVARPTGRHHQRRQQQFAPPQQHPKMRRREINPREFLAGVPWCKKRYAIRVAGFGNARNELQRRLIDNSRFRGAALSLRTTAYR